RPLRVSKKYFRHPAKEIGNRIPISFDASISCKMAFSQAKTLILRPEIDIGSGFQPLLGDVHAAACGLLMKGLRPLHTSPGVF
ncbi:MAG: hypothetical protein IJQ33_09330, partial [Clostridia bacterium]|nr:hypothetical protein [Clostridia bacterium]